MQSRNINPAISLVLVDSIQYWPVIVFEKFRFSPVHTETQKRCFEKNPLWRAFSKRCLFGDRFHQIRVNGSRIRNEKAAKYVWTRPKSCIALNSCVLFKIVQATLVLACCLSPKIHHIMFFWSLKNKHVFLPFPEVFFMLFVFYLFTFDQCCKIWFYITVHCACTKRLSLFCGKVLSNILLFTHHWLLLLYLFIVPHFN